MVCLSMFLLMFGIHQRSKTSPKARNIHKAFISVYSELQLLWDTDSRAWNNRCNGKHQD